MMRMVYEFRVVFGLIFILSSIYACSSSEESDNHLPYSVADSKSFSIGAESYRELRVRVQSAQAPSDQALLDIGDVIFAENTGYDHVRIFIYAPSDDIEGIAYCRMDYSYGELVESVAFGDASTW